MATAHKADNSKAIRSRLVQLGIRLFVAGKAESPQRSETGLQGTSDVARRWEAAQRRMSDAEIGAEMDDVLASHNYQLRPTVELAAMGSDLETIHGSNRQSLLAQKLTILTLQRFVREIIATASDAAAPVVELPVWATARQQAELERDGLRSILKPAPEEVAPAAEFLERSRDWVWENEQAIAHMFRSCLDALVDCGLIGIAQVDKQFRSATVWHHEQRTGSGEATQGARQELTLSDVLVVPRPTHTSRLRRYMPAEILRWLEQTPELICLREVIVGTADAQHVLDGDQIHTTRMNQPYGMLTLFRHYLLATWNMTVLEQQR